MDSFDPTTIDKKEWDRLVALKWLPPIKVKSVGASDNSQQKLPKKVSLKLKKRALYLEELAIFLEEKERQDAESMERKWTIAKQMSKSPRFLNYIHMLQDKSRSAENEEKISSPKQVEFVDNQPIVKSLELKGSIAEKSLEHRSLYDLQELISKSAFKPKEKSLKRSIVINEELKYDFSKPQNISEDISVEFGRTFRDINQLGSIAKDKWSKALADKKAFGVRKTHDSVDNLKSKSRYDVLKTTSESKKIIRANYEPNQSPAFKNSVKFNTLRQEERSKLLTCLESRKKDRFNRSKALETINPIFKLIEEDLSNLTPRRQGSIWRDTLPHLWAQNPFDEHKKPKKEDARNIVKLPPKKKDKPNTSIAFEQPTPPTPSDVKSTIRWKKITAVASLMPRGPRNSISVQKPSDLIRLEFKELMKIV